MQNASKYFTFWILAFIIDKNKVNTLLFVGNKGGEKMKKLFQEHFERTWLIIFLFMLALIIIPFPFFYSETYIPAAGGVPLFLFGWFIHTAVTFVLIVIYYRMCMKRKEYHIYDEENQEGGDA